MNRTIALYDADAYQKEFTAQVCSCKRLSSDADIAQWKEETHGFEVGEGMPALFAVVLDQTLFFPEQGGQVPDRGFLAVKDFVWSDVLFADDAAPAAGVSSAGADVAFSGLAFVLDVQIADGVITHTVLASVDEGEDVPAFLQPDGEISGRIDFGHRFDLMQNHSGEHIFSGLVHGRFGYDNVGFRLSHQEMTIDFSGLLTPEEVRTIEFLANTVIVSDREILVSYPTDDEAEQIDYRSKKEVSGALRLVTIPDVDVCACCAPHVRRTGEIGLLKVVKIMKNKGGTRLKVLCGFRALQYLSDEHAILHEASDMLSTSAENVPDRIRRFKEEIYALKGEIRSLQKQ